MKLEGRGIEKVNEECDRLNAPHPEFNHEFSGLMMTFTARELDERVIAQSTDQVITGKSSGKVLEILSKYPETTVPELSRELGISTRAVEKQMKKLKDAGKLVRSGGRKEGNWKVIVE